MKALNHIAKVFSSDLGSQYYFEKQGSVLLGRSALLSISSRWRIGLCIPIRFILHGIVALGSVKSVVSFSYGNWKA